MSGIMLPFSFMSFQRYTSSRFCQPTVKSRAPKPTASFLRSDSRRCVSGAGAGGPGRYSLGFLSSAITRSKLLAVRSNCQLQQLAVSGQKFLVIIHENLEQTDEDGV